MAELRRWIVTLAAIGLGWALLFGSLNVLSGYWILAAVLMFLVTGTWLVAAMIRVIDLFDRPARRLRSRPSIQDSTRP